MFFDPIPDPTAPEGMPAVTFGDMVDSLIQNMQGRNTSKSTSFAREFDDYKQVIKRAVLNIAIAYNHYEDFALGNPQGDPVDNATHEVYVDRIAITPGDLSFYNVQFSFHMIPRNGLERQAKNGLSLPMLRVIRVEDLPIVRLSARGIQCRDSLVSQAFGHLENFSDRWGFSSDVTVPLEWTYGDIRLTANLQLVQSKPEVEAGMYGNGLIEYILKEVIVNSPKVYSEDEEPLKDPISIYEKAEVIFDQNGNSNFMADLTEKLNKTFWQMFMNLENRMLILETNRFG